MKIVETKETETTVLISRAGIIFTTPLIVLGYVDILSYWWSVACILIGGGAIIKFFHTHPVRKQTKHEN